MPDLPTVVCVPGSSDCPSGLPLPDQNGSASLHQHCAGEVFLNNLLPLFLLEASSKAPCWDSLTSLGHLENAHLHLHLSRLQFQISGRGPIRHQSAPG